MAGRKPEFDIPPDGYETAPVAVADDAPPDGYEGPSTGYKGVGASGSWDQPQPAVVPQPVVPHIQMPQNPDAMSTYKEALTAYLVGNRDLAKAKAEAALSLDTGLTEAKNMLTRMRVNPLAGTNAPRPEYSPQKFTDYTVGQMAADTYNAIDQSPVVRTLGSGVARIGAGLSRVPNLAANIFALPYNTIVTLTGNEDMAQRSPKMFEKEARWWDEKATQLSEGFRRWGSKGEDFVSVAKRKDPGEIASYIAYKVLEEAPQQAIVIGTTMAGIPAAGLSYMGASSSAQELAATPENVNPAAATVNAIVNGTVEAALEQTPALMGKWSKAIEEAVGKKGRGEVIKAVAKTIGSSIVQEGLVEEAPTEYLQSASRVMTGVDPNAMQGVGGRMIEAATIGGAMGGGMTAPAAIGSGIQMGAGKLGPGDFPPDGFNENNTPQGPIPPSPIGQSVAPLDIKQNPNYSLGDESARLAGSSDSVVNVPGVLDLRRGADTPVVPADRVLPSAMPADANIPAPVQSPGNYERVALPQSPAIPNLEQPAPAESQSALPQPPQLDQQQPKYQAEPEKASVFYSQLQRTLNEKMPNAAPVAMVRNLIDPAKGNVKAEEVEWSGINEFLQGKEKVSKTELLDFLKSNEVQIKEVVKGNDGSDEEIKKLELKIDRIRSRFQISGYQIENNAGWTHIIKNGEMQSVDSLPENLRSDVGEFRSAQDDIARLERNSGKETKFKSYQLPGGSDYREVLLTLPGTVKGETSNRIIEATIKRANKMDIDWDKLSTAEREKLYNKMANEMGGEKPRFVSSHFDEPNILAHVRMNDRTTADGKRVLFLEEVQSDWGQANKKVLREITKPQSISELTKDVFNGELASMMPFDVVDGGVLSLGNHDQISAAIVSNLPVDVVNKFGGKKAATNSLFGNTSMVLGNLPADHRLAVAERIVAATRKVGADLRAKLTSGLKTGSDVELFPALKASDLTPREIVGVLSPESIYHVGLSRAPGDLNVARPGTELPSTSGVAGVNPNRFPATGTGAIESEFATGQRTERGRASAGSNAKGLSASPTEIINWHTKILQQIGVSKQTSYMPAPFVGKTDSWVGFSLKRILRYAVDNGYDGIAWTTGEQQAERYDLSKQIQTLEWQDKAPVYRAGDPDGGGRIIAHGKSGDRVMDKVVTKEQLPDMIGKEAARKILEMPIKDGFRTLAGVDLKVGGEGMKGFYDQIIPAFLNKYTKKWGGKVSVADIEELGVHTLEITPSMRESVAQGQPMFQADRPTSGTTEGQSEALTAFNKIISASKMTDAVFAELVDSIRPDPAAFRKGYGTEYSADKFAIRGATYPIRNHPTIRALVRFAKGAHQGTGYHEAMHVIFNNVLTVQERQVLMDKFGTEEQAAEAFARYEAKRTGMEKPSRIKAIFDKILELLGQLRSYMAGKGWKTAEDVFKSVEQGRTERRRAAGRGEAKYQAEKQKDQTGTEAFKRWFGDSKVVDADGKPLVVYHGTSEKGLSGDAFSKDLLGAVTKSRSAKAGFYFVANKDAAAGYSRLANSKPVQDLIDKSNAAERAGKFDLANRLMVQAEKLEQTASPKENVVGAYLSIQKPFEFDASEQRFLDIQNEIHDAIREAKTGGYDGIVFRNLIDNADWGSERALDHWVAFEPTQIKSATGNAGTFDPENPSILYQAERVESDKAMLPNGGYVPLAKLSKLQRIYRGWLTTDRGVGQAIDRANEERIGKIMETAFDAPVTGKQLLKYFKENPSDDLRQAVFEALTGQRSIFELPADITGIVQKMREDVDALSRVIAQTAAPNDRLKAVIERNLGRYLGRHYKLFERKNWRPSNEVISRAKAKLREMHPNTIGKASSQELNGIIENIISKGDVTFHRGDRRIDIPQNHFVKRKDIPKEIRDLYGEITDPVWAYLKTMADQSTVAHNADFLSKISGMEGVFKDKPDETHFKQIPDVARWGAVRGKFTTQEVNDFLIEAIDPVDSGLFRFVEKLIVNPFKWTKTVASLPSHPRNFIGNTMFSVLAGNTITNPANIPYYWKALRVIMGKEGKYRGTWKELVRARVADTQFWGSEMPKLMAEMISDPVSWPDKIMNTVKWPVEKLGELYNNEDLIYRVSAFLKYRDNGMTINQAAQEVDKWFTNYARLPKAVKTARRIGVFGPFLSFKANTARILINAAKESGEGIKKGNPAPALRLAFVVSFIPLLQMAMRTVFDIDDDEKKNLDKLQDMGPIYKRNSTPIYYRTAEGSIKAFDLGYIWPTGEFDKAARAALVGDAESFTESIDLFQHPLFDAYSILFNNFNTRNRQNVANVNDPMPRRAADKMAELARMLYVPASSPIPSIRGMAKGQYEPGLLTGYQIKTLYDAYHGVEDRFGRTREVPEELRAFFTGIRTWEIRPDDTKKAFRMRKAGEFQEAKRELRRYMRMPGISQEEKERRMDDWKRRVAKIRSDVESSNSVKLK